MAPDIRELFQTAQADEHPPPLGDLVQDAVRQGQRMRRRRNLLAGTGAVGGVAVIMAAAVLAFSPGGTPSAPDASAIAAGAAAIASAQPKCPAKADPNRFTAPLKTKRFEAAGGPPVFEEPSAGTVKPPTIKCAATSTDFDFTVADVDTSGPQADMTATGLLELLTRLLPKGVPTSDFATFDNGPVGPAHPTNPNLVQVYVDRGKGPGMIRFSVEKNPELTLSCRDREVCYDLPDGSRIAVVSGAGEGYVNLIRPDRTVISLMIWDLLAWDGKQNAPGRIGLSRQEAISIVLDPRWGMRMPKEIVDAGAKNFPDLTVREN